MGRGTIDAAGGLSMESGIPMSARENWRTLLLLASWLLCIHSRTLHAQGQPTNPDAPAKPPIVIPSEVPPAAPLPLPVPPAANPPLPGPDMRDPPEGPEAAPERRDPTVPQGELRMLLSPPVTEGPGGTVVAGPAPLPALPAISVRARVIGPGKQASALLSTGTSYYLVTPGQSYHLVGNEDRELKVISITREGVKLEFSPDRRQLILP